MNNNIKQVLVGSMLGDGYLSQQQSFCTGCKYKEYIDFKANILKQYVTDKSYRLILENGYAGKSGGGIYHRLDILKDKEIKELCLLPLKDLIEHLDEFGLAIWIYDDGSLHQKKLFYNINTHSFSKEEHEEILIPFLRRRFGLDPTLTSETKKDGRHFWYIRINKKGGAEIINSILKKYPVNCYSYKTYIGNIDDTIKVKNIVAQNIATKEIFNFPSMSEAGKLVYVSYGTIKSYVESKKPLRGYVFYYSNEFNDQSKDVEPSGPKQKTPNIGEDMV